MVWKNKSESELYEDTKGMYIHGTTMYYSLHASSNMDEL